MSFVAIHTVRAVGIAAAFGVASKIVSNLVLLPVLASYTRLDASFARRAVRSHALGANCINRDR